MDTIREPHKDRRRRAAVAERWFLRVAESTLGPFTLAQVMEGLRRRDFLPDHKICPAIGGSWGCLRDHPVLAEAIAALGKSSAQLSSLPPPRQLRRQPTPPPPPIAESLAETLAMPPPGVAPSSPVEEPPPDEPKEAEGPAKEAAKLLGNKDTEKRQEEKAETTQQASPVAKKSQPEPAPEVSALIPARPAEIPIFLAEPRARPCLERKERELSRVIRIELKLPERPWRLLLLIAMGLGLAYLVTRWAGPGQEEKKTRDLKDFRLSGPSSPTVAPLETGDPIPPLKAPTRPRRE